MFKIKERTFYLIYSVIVLLELICVGISTFNYFHYITKPLILISLLLFFWAHSKNLDAYTRKLIFYALIYSLIGDVVLMFAHISNSIFIAGIIWFFLAHFMYILVFFRQRNTKRIPILAILIFLAYGVGFFMFIRNYLEAFMFTVIVYMITISVMGVTSYMRKGNVNKNSFLLVFIGALFFMLSDSILAINKFYQEFALSGIAIMLTYSIAQFLIVIGVLRSYDRD